MKSAQIIDMETSIMLRLQATIVQQSIEIVDAVRAAARIDCVIAMAEAANEHDWHRPELVDDVAVLDITAGRHPLVEARVTPFVGNDFCSDDSRKVLVLAGPNASGKSIFLKQVSLCVFAFVCEQWQHRLVLSHSWRTSARMCRVHVRGLAASIVYSLVYTP
jgi:DNA mismatch repair ATPase MutS